VNARPERPGDGKLHRVGYYAIAEEASTAAIAFKFSRITPGSPVA
jgi:hypothetical protein